MSGSGGRPDVGRASAAPATVPLHHVAAGAVVVGVVLLAWMRGAAGPRWDLPSGATEITERRQDFHGFEGDYRYELGATVSPEGFDEFVRSIGLTQGVPPDCASACSGMSHATRLGREHCTCAGYSNGRLEFLATHW